MGLYWSLTSLVFPLSKSNVDPLYIGLANFTVKYEMRENKVGKGREYSKHNVFPSLFFREFVKSC